MDLTGSSLSRASSSANQDEDAGGGQALPQQGRQERISPMSDAAPTACPMKVQVLGPQCFAAAYEWTSGQQGNVEAVIHGAFEHPQAGRIDAFAKFYRADGRGLVNEITGWLLAQAHGLPVPAHAFIALVPLDKLPAPLEGVAALAQAHGRPHFPAFATSSAAPVAVQPVIETTALVDEIRRWPHLPNCVAVDERIANTDRHARNLVRRGLRDFVAIDHGRLAWTPLQPEWTAATVADSAAPFDNRLSAIAWGPNPDAKAGSSVLARAATLARPDEGLAAELAFWWSTLVPDVHDRTAWQDFIMGRLDHVEYLLRNRFSLLA